MNPLIIRIQAGQEDDRLLEHIDNLSMAKIVGDLSPIESLILYLCWQRLDKITK